MALQPRIEHVKISIPRDALLRPDTWPCVGTDHGKPLTLVATDIEGSTEVTPRDWHIPCLACSARLPAIFLLTRSHVTNAAMGMGFGYCRRSHQTA